VIVWGRKEIKVENESDVEERGEATGEKPA
jgi:hypothetical protein